MNPVIFHLAFPILDIPTTKAFYVDGLGCQIGRESSNSIILNMYGHQIVAHIDHDITPQKSIYPRHFGLVFTNETDWEELLNRAQEKNLNFRQKARNRFVGEITEHRTFFLEDPSYNLLEFKYYRHAIAIFGATDFGQVGDTL
jgi:uncharacterized protein